MQAGDLALGGVAARRVPYQGKGGAGGTGEFLGSAFGGILRGSEEWRLLACAFGGWGVVTSGCVWLRFPGECEETILSDRTVFINTSASLVGASTFGVHAALSFAFVRRFRLILLDAFAYVHSVLLLRFVQRFRLFHSALSFAFVRRFRLISLDAFAYVHSVLLLRFVQRFQLFHSVLSCAFGRRFLLFSFDVFVYFSLVFRLFQFGAPWNLLAVGRPQG